MSAFFGKWDLIVGDDRDRFPSWAEFHADGTGWFVGRVGSARPIANIHIDGDRIRFQLPKQYEGRDNDLIYEGWLQGDQIAGFTSYDNGTPTTFTARRAPSYEAVENPQFGEPIELIGGDLSNWKLRSPDWVNNWSIDADGVLVNSATGSDLITTETFTDFRLVAEYCYPAGSNSGIYLRGRYEFQVLDDFGKEPSVGSSGAIYGFHAPTKNAVKPAGEWNTAEITLIGRTVTVVLNGETIVGPVDIPGITGGALDSNEGEPGPLFVQGDHGPVSYRKLTLFPRLS